MGTISAGFLASSLDPSHRTRPGTEALESSLDSDRIATRFRIHGFARKFPHQRRIRTHGTHTRQPEKDIMK